MLTVLTVVVVLGVAVAVVVLLLGVALAVTGDVGLGAVVVTVFGLEEGVELP